MRALYTGQSPYIFDPNAAGDIPHHHKADPNHAGVAPPIDTGYDVDAIRMGAARRNPAMQRANGSLRDDNWFVKFFVNEIAVDIGLAGSTGQGKYTRDFYPRNIAIPSLNLVCQSLDQLEYGTVVEFVHQAQQKAVAKGTLLQLEVNKGGIDTRRPIMKGGHLPIVCQGYIKSMPRQYKAGEYAPLYSFSFVISQMFVGIYDKEVNSYETEQKDWIQIIAGLQAASPNTISPQKIAKDVVKGVNEVAEKVDTGIKNLF